MSYLNNSFQPICYKNNYVLQAYAQPDALNIRLQTTLLKNQSKRYFFKIQSLKDCGFVTEDYDNYDKLLELLSQPNNIQFDSENQTLKIYSNNDPEHLTQLATLKLSQNSTINPETNQSALQRILQKCQSGNDLTPKQIKQSFKQVSTCLRKIFNELRVKNIKDEEKTQPTIHQLNGLQKNDLQIGNKNLEYIQIIKQFKQKQQMNQKKQIQLKDQCQRLLKDILGIKIKLQEEIDEIKDSMEVQLLNFTMKMKLQVDGLINGVKAQLINQLSNKIDKNQNKLSLVAQDIERRIKKAFQRLETVEYAFRLNGNLWPTRGSDFIDPNCNNFKNLQIDINKITNKNNDDNGWVHIYSKITLKQKHQFRFKFDTITKCAVLGIVDSDYIKDASIKENYIAFASVGRCFVGFNQPFGEKNKGFKTGELIQLFVDQGLGLIQWRIDGQIRKKIQAPLIIKDPRIEWVPFVYLHNREDSVCIFD